MARSFLIAARTVLVGLLLLAVDPALLRALHTIIPATPWLTKVCEAAEGLLSQPAVAGIVLVYVALNRSERLRHFAVLAGTMATQGVAVSLLKKVFSRMRPAEFGGEVLFTGPTMHHAHSSFPGGHAAAAFALAAILAAWHPRLRLPLYIAATLMTLTRIYLDRHFFSDCFIGAALGYWIAQCFLVWVPLRKGARAPEAA
jgi:undecaprenyl-diphosphatase